MIKGDFLNEKKNLGASLIYVLIALSMITVFSTNFIFFVKQKSDIVFLKNTEKKLDKKTFVEKELENAKRFVKNGVTFENNQVEIEKEEFYFDTNLQKVENNLRAENLIFFPKKVQSIGGFTVKSIKDSSENEYFLPLDKNTVYGDLEVIFERKILDTEIFYKEKISFKRKNAILVEMRVLSGEILK